MFNKNKIKSGVPTDDNIYQRLDAIRKDDLAKNNTQNDENIDKGSEKLAIDNAFIVGRNKTTDLQNTKDITKLAGSVNQYQVAGSPLDISVTRIAPTNTTDVGRIDYSMTMKQLGFFNPTTSVIKIAYGRVCKTDDYDVICNANKCGIFPPNNFITLYYLVETGSNGFIMPTLYAYADDDKNVGISSI